MTDFNNNTPIEGKQYLCRCINNEGKIIYRIDEFRSPSIFEEKYEGITLGWQGDFQSPYKVDAWHLIEDEYNEHIIQFNSERESKIYLDGEILKLHLSNLKKYNNNEEFPEIYYYLITGCWGTKIINGEMGTTTIEIIVKIYMFEDNTIKIIIPKTNLFNECKDRIFNNFFKKYFNYSLINQFHDDLYKFYEE